MSRKEKIELLKAVQRGDKEALIQALDRDSGFTIYMDLGSGQYKKGGQVISETQYRQKTSKSTWTITLKL